MKKEEFSPEVQKALQLLSVIQLCAGNFVYRQQYESEPFEDEATLLESIHLTVSTVQSDLDQIRQLLPAVFNK